MASAKPKGGLTKWFKEDWVDIGRKKKGYPKCVPKSKAANMTAAQKRSAVKRKRAKAQGVGGKPTRVRTMAKKKTTRRRK